MFERFTERARNTIIQAQNQARSLNHSYVGTEHILLGLLQDENTTAARILKALNITSDDVRTEVLRIVGQDDKPCNDIQLPFSERARTVLQITLREALALGHNYVGTGHILLGLARTNEGIAARILQDHDTGTEKISNKIIRVLAVSGLAKD